MAVDGGCVFSRLRKERNGIVVLLVLFGATEWLCLDGRVRRCPALLLSLQDKLKGEMIRLNIAKSLGGDAIPHVRDRRSYLEIDFARPLWERNVLGLDQEAGARAGARIYIFPEKLVFSCPQHYCHNGM